MSIKKVVENALNLLDKADDGIVLMNMYNEVVYPADAAFKGQVVYPYNAKSFVEESFRQNGIDLKDKELRLMLLKLLLSFEQMEANKVRKGKLNELLKEAEFKDFGKLM
ncbi:MAG: hypothetical protein KGZ90_08870 [Algoriphagus sp.]|nr:hypothetical protein [Algoriphagus sp.]